MKATLEFNLPDDAYEFRCARLGQTLDRAVEEFGEYLRQQTKYGDPPDDVHKIREQWFAVMGEVLEALE